MKKILRSELIAHACLSDRNTFKEVLNEPEKAWLGSDVLVFRHN